MSPAAAALASGRDTLLGTHGETLQFRVGEAGETEVTAIVYRKDPEQLPRKSPDFSSKEASWLRMAPMADEPIAGETFIDGLGFYHRVTEPKRISEVWFQCKCEVSKAP